MAIKYRLSGNNNRKLVIKFNNGEKGGVFSAKQIPALIRSMFYAEYLFGNKKIADLPYANQHQKINLKKL